VGGDGGAVGGCAEVREKVASGASGGGRESAAEGGTNTLVSTDETVVTVAAVGSLNDDKKPHSPHTHRDHALASPASASSLANVFGGGRKNSMMISLCGRVLQERGNLTRSEQQEAFDRHLVTQDQFLSNPLDIASSPELYVSVNGDIYRWQLMAPAVLSALVYHTQLPTEVHQELVTLDSRFAMFQTKGSKYPSGEHHDRDGYTVDASEMPDLFMRLCSDSDDNDEDLELHARKRYTKKTNTPTQEQLLSMPLQEGANVLRFYLASGVAPVTASIYLWSYKSKVVISDVDGTITKSDLLGET
jgi:phosphatidate phosphatase LPIN